MQYIEGTEAGDKLHICAIIAFLQVIFFFHSQSLEVPLHLTYSTLGGVSFKAGVKPKYINEQINTL